MSEYFLDPYDMQGKFYVPSSMVAQRPYRGLEYLLPFYLLPREIIAGTHLIDMPRNPLKVALDASWLHMYTSDYFKEVISRAWGFLVWPHLGVPGRMDDYAGESYFYTVATSYIDWFIVLGQLGHHPNNFADIKQDYDIIFFPLEEINNLAKRMVAVFKENSNFVDIKEVYLKHPDFEDFDPKRKSRVKIDFYRKYYHSRTKQNIHINFKSLNEQTPRTT